MTIKQSEKTKMSCANFESLDNFDLCVNECDTYGNEEFADSEYDYFINSYLIKANDKLKFFDLELVSGYYSGMQVIPKQKYCYFNAEDFLKYYNEYSGRDIYAEHKVNKYILKKQIEKEIKYINNVIFKELQNEYGFEILEIQGTFSNGETIYRTKVVVVK